MVQTLDRPGHQYDEDWKPSESNTDELEDAYNAPDAEYPEGHPSKRKKSLSDEELAGSESSASSESKASTGGTGSEHDDEGGAEGSLYRKGKKKTRGKLTRKQGAIGGTIAALIVSVFMAVVTQGPSLVIMHLRDALLSRVGSVQMYQSRRYRQSKLGKLKNLFSTDGRRGQKIITEMEEKGYKFHFGDATDKNKITGLTRPNGTEGLIGDGIGNEIDDFMESSHPLRSARWKTKRMDAFYNRFGVTRSSPVDKAKLGADDADPEKTVNKEMANDVVEENPKEMTGEQHGTTDDDTDLTDEEKAQNEQTKKGNEIESSADEVGGEVGESLDEVNQRLLDGESVSDIAKDNPIMDAVTDVDDAGPRAVATAENIAKGTLGERALTAAKEFFNPTAILDKVCTLRNRLRQAQTAARAIRAIKLMRYVAVFVKSGDDVRRGAAAAGLINELMKRVMSEDSMGNSFGSSSGFSVLSKGKFSKGQNSQTRNKIAVDGQLQGVFGELKNMTDGFPGMSKCWAWQNPAFQVAVGAGDLIVKGLSCVFTACAEAAAETAAEEGVKTLVVNFIKEKIEETFTKAFFKKLALEALKQAALQITFEGAMSLVQLYAQKTIMTAFTGQETGGQLSDILVGGGGTLNKNRSAAAGLVPATTEQYSQAVQEYYAWKKEDLSKQSFFARTFDINNPDSLAFSGLTAAIGTGSGGVVTSASNLASMATGLLSGGFFTKTLSYFSGSASAAVDDEIEFDSYTLDGGDYSGTNLATDMAGNPQYIMRSDIQDIDPETNEAALISAGDIDAATKEPKSDAFKKYMDDCVDNPDTLSKLEFESADCLATKQETKNFVAQLAYSDMMDGVDAEVDPGSLGDSSGPAPSTQTSPVGGSLPSGTAQELAKQILASGKVTGDSRYMAQIQGVADGTGTCHVNPTILGMILSLSAQFELKISSLNRRCTGVLTASGADSYHYREQGGHAVDFNFVNGVHSTGGTEQDLALMRAAAAIIPQGSGFGQINCRAAIDLPGMRQFNDTCNHVHIQVPVQ